MNIVVLETFTNETGMLKTNENSLHTRNDLLLDLSIGWVHLRISDKQKYK